MEGGESINISIQTWRPIVNIEKKQKKQKTNKKNMTQYNLHAANKTFHDWIDFSNFV